MYKKQPDFYKAAGVLIKDRKLLAVRSKKYPNLLMSPGGKIEAGETPPAAVARELYEELQINVAPENIDYLGTFDAPASTDESKLLRMEVFLIKKWSGNPTASNEIIDFEWINSQVSSTKNVGSVIIKHIIPYLLQRNLID